jgi:hypothetical protein
MYALNQCPCCNSTDIKLKPAGLSRFVIWRTTGKLLDKDLHTNLLECNECLYRGSNLRFNPQEEASLYKDYRGKEYDRQRLICEPNYYSNPSLFTPDLYDNRKLFIDTIIDKNLDLGTINSVLDYGGDDGRFIPDITGDRYVYDLSGVELLPGIKRFNPGNFTNAFDLLMCCQVLEHISDLDEIMQRLNGYIAKGSWVYVDVPSYKSPPSDNMVIGEHINFFNADALTKLLHRYGIETVDVAVNSDINILGILGKLK